MKQFLLAAMLIAAPVAAFTAFQVNFVAPSAAAASLGDLSALKAIAADVQSVAKTGDWAAAQKRATDFETAWDDAESGMRPLNEAAWGKIDKESDAALRAVRASTPDGAKVDSAWGALGATLASPY